MSFRDSQRLEHAILAAWEEASQSELSDENRSRLAQLMTVWASGYLEAVCREVLLSYAKIRCDETVASFVASQLNRFQNPKMDLILDLVGKFDLNRRDELAVFVEGKIAESVSSIVGLRHQIAHGRSCSVSVGRVIGYFEDAQKLAAKLEQLFPRNK